jgi:ferritin-like metal-binding protein YciE
MKAQESMAKKQIGDLLYQALETELGGVEIYRMAILCAKNEDLQEEWKKYLEQTERHVEVVRGIFDALGMDPEATTPGRQIVRDKGNALLSAIQKALKDAPQAAQIVAAECVVDAETKDHGNWQLIGALAQNATGAAKKALTEAYEKVEDEEDEHLYHTQGWCRELWLDSLGLPSVLPPPEEKKDVKSAVEAARAAEQRKPKVKRSGNGGRRPQSRA